MCGVAGIIELSGRPLDRSALERMSAVLTHRGPDDSGIFVDGPVGLAHRRLSIIDLTTGHQPMSVDGTTITFNGEIYNYVELRAELVRLGHSFRTTSDTEVLLRMYLQYGDDCIRRLNGMFAFALYDAGRQRVVFARDHFGIKPLYLQRSHERVLFASEIKGILEHPAARREVNAQALDDYVTLQYVLGAQTLFNGIEKILPAHYEVLDLRTGAWRCERYWRPSFELDRGRTEQDTVEELKSLLADSVRLQMRSDVPVGAYLSGGLDSGTVTMLAARETGTPLKTFTGAFHEGPEFDESEHAFAVARACGADPYLIHPGESDFVELLPRLSYHMDEPAAGPGLFPQFMVSRLAARHVKVCLGGQGGDEIFGGYARYVIGCFEQAMKGAIYGGNPSDEGGVSLADMAPNLPYIRQYVPLLTRFLQQGLFDSADRRYFALMDRSEGVIDAYSGAFRRRYDREAVFSRFEQVFREPETDSYYNRMLNYDMATGLPSLLQVEDRVSMAVSLESRVPLLDYRIVDLLARTPPGIKFKGGEMKFLFKAAIRDLLPRSVLERRDKMGFPVPLQHWARGAARDFFNDVLLSQRTRERGLFEPAAVERLLNQEAAFSRVLWGLLQLELWHRQFIDSGPATGAGIGQTDMGTRACH
jgi:asparagine synthase (glutamine-hydrolysing)